MANKETLRPTSYSGGGQTTNEANAYDLGCWPHYHPGTPTYADIALGSDASPEITYDTWETDGQYGSKQTYTALTLGVCWETDIQTGNDQWGIEYTTDGSTWSDLLAKGVNRASTYTESETAIAADTNFANLAVRINVDRKGGGDGLNIYIHDIYTTGTFSGDTWTEEFNGADETPAQGGVECVCALSDDVILIGTTSDGQIWKSADSGDTWTLKKDLSNETPAQRGVGCIVKLSSTSALAFSLDDAQVWKSTDSGDTWSEQYDMNNDPASSWGTDIYAAYTYDGTNVVVALQSTGKVALSDDGGATWALATDDLLEAGDSSAYPRWMHGTGSTNIWAVTSVKVWQSTDGGDTWTMIKDLGTDESAIVWGVHCVDSSNVLVGSGTPYEIWKYNGSTWTSVWEVTTDYTHCLGGLGAIKPFITLPNGDIMAGSYFGAYFLKSTDDGDTWSVSSELMTDEDFLQSHGMCVTDNGYVLACGVGFGGFAPVFLCTDYYEAPPDYNLAINISDAWKEGANAGVQINIGDTWKNVTEMKINIGDAWKTITLP